MADAGFVKVAQVSEISPGDMITVDYPHRRRGADSQRGRGNPRLRRHLLPRLRLAVGGGHQRPGGECPLHGAVFNITTGEALTPPAESPIKVYQVQVEGDDIYVAPPQE